MRTNRPTKPTNILANEFHCDVIGKPDPVTNLRPIKFYVPETESGIEKLYRQERIRVHEWNDEFWRHHNETFKRERDDFRRQYVETTNSNAADELSKFYKDFLDRNWRTHCRYNIDWYKKNMYLSSLALRVNVSRVLSSSGCMSPHLFYVTIKLKFAVSRDVKLVSEENRFCLRALR